MTIPVTHGKMVVHSTVVTNLAYGYANLTKMALVSSPTKFEFIPCDIGLGIADVALAFITKDMLIKQSIIPNDIMK